jgi:cytoskeletal protein CcmA (bactofilin family)
MGIFNKGDNERLPVGSSKTTIISEGSQIKGELKFSGSVHIDGFVDGSIFCEAVVTVGKSGKVKGFISADKIIVKGFIDGNAECNVIEILEGGKFTGEIQYNQIMIEPKGVFEGSLKIRGGKIKKIDDRKEDVKQKNEAVQ